MSKKLIISALLIFMAAGFLFVNECAYGGAMASSYKDCDCLGYEWEQYDQTPADGPRRTICIGVVLSWTVNRYRREESP
jgi:hypothetical protein